MTVGPMVEQIYVYGSVSQFLDYRTVQGLARIDPFNIFRTFHLCHQERAVGTSTFAIISTSSTETADSLHPLILTVQLQELSYEEDFGRNSLLY